jgi:TRAP-type transport system periplasmic protein
MSLARLSNRRPAGRGRPTATIRKKDFRMRRLLAFTTALGLAATMSVSAFAAEITLRASHNANPDEPYQLGMERMGERLSELTGGEATIQAFPNAQLGDEMESIQGTQIGTIDIAVTANETLVNFVPDMSVLSMPFLFDSPEQKEAALSDPEVRAYVDQVLEAQGYKLLGFFSAGTRHVMSSKPINEMSDMSGLKIRTMQNAAHLATFEDFGANPTPMAYMELYGALETGVVDGAEAANTNYYSQKFYEVAPNWAVLGWLELIAPVIIGKDRFDALPPEVQTALTQAGEDASAYQRELYATSDTERLADIEAAGVTVTHPDPAPFRAEAEKVYAEFVTTDGQKELMRLIKEAN